jgi:hypothetical protein
MCNIGRRTLSRSLLAILKADVGSLRQLQNSQACQRRCQGVGSTHVETPCLPEQDAHRCRATQINLTCVGSSIRHLKGFYAIERKVFPIPAGVEKTTPSPFLQRLESSPLSSDFRTLPDKPEVCASETSEKLGISL